MKARVLLVSLLLWSGLLLADDSQPSLTIETLVKQRIALLTQILEIAEKRYHAGGITEEQFLNATIDLYALKRDSAKIPAEQVSWQERIVAVERQKKASLEKQMSVGTAGVVDVLRASERVLAAEQKQLELQAAK